jgi:hypothetical protein
MNKILITVMLSMVSLSGFAQRFAQYNTGTLFDSFENPSQGAFIPDSSRRFAFNLIPNFNVNTYLVGNSQYPLKSRLFSGNYNTEAITIGQGNYSNVLAHVNVYVGMFKMFTSLSGKQEVGVSYQIKANGRGHVTDETLALFNGVQPFVQPNYYDLFNGNAFYESYNQFSTTYREKVTRNFSVGIKLSLLSGIAYNRAKIVNSSLTNINRAAGTADFALNGIFQSTYRLGNFQKRDLLPTFKSPGASVSLGTTYIAPGGIILQGNIKDLGFIHWSDDAVTYRFNRTARLRDLNSGLRERRVNDALTSILESTPTNEAFTKPIVGRAEISAAKKFQFGMVTYMPTAIISRQVYGLGTAAALVNNIQFAGFGTTVSGIWNEDKLFDLGLQVMYKTPNVEFFVGSEQLTRSFNLLSASNDNIDAINKTMSHSGGNIYLGFSFKFGKLIERWKGESYYQNGAEQGPLGRAWQKAFNK